MNKCTFMGKILSKTLSELDSVPVIDIELLVTSHRKTKNGSTVDKVVLPFEAWDSAAEVINSFPIGTNLLIIESVVKNVNGDIRFRINEFCKVG